MFEGTLSTGPLDYTFICLVPKKEGAKHASDFCPISLLNGIQKILSKVLANRLELILNELIDPGRNITDAFVDVYELLGWCSKQGVEGVGVKMDFEKAYDRIYWSFLFRVLDWWGFDNKWCSWINLCVCFAKIAVSVNGEATN